jgi:hypothetical protein
MFDHSKMVSRLCVRCDDEKWIKTRVERNLLFLYTDDKRITLSKGQKKTQIENKKLDRLFRDLNPNYVQHPCSQPHSQTCLPTWGREGYPQGELRRIKRGATNYTKWPHILLKRKAYIKIWMRIGRLRGGEAMRRVVKAVMWINGTLEPGVI